MMDSACAEYDVLRNKNRLLEQGSNSLFLYDLCHQTVYPSPQIGIPAGDVDVLHLPNLQCDLVGRNSRCFRRTGRKFLELNGFLPQQCTPHFPLPAVEAGKRYAILCTPTFYALPTLFCCSDRLLQTTEKGA